MLINFNIEKLDRLLYDFYHITGMTVSIWDSQFQQLSFQPKEMQNFCRTIRKSPEINHRCFLSDKKVCQECARTGKPTVHHCHAGLVDIAIPIKFKDTVLGYMMFGQIADSNLAEQRHNLEKLANELDMDYVDLYSIYSTLEAYDKSKVDSAANLLKLATRSLWLSEYIEIGYNTLASKLDDYIRNHLSEDLSVENLCDKLGISKNRLYETAHDSFGTPIGKYVTDCRMEEAKRLLNTTDLPVSRISSMVGISDYNYFTKVFKASVGIPPLRYRKEFPFNTGV